MIASTGGGERTPVGLEIGATTGLIPSGNLRRGRRWPAGMVSDSIKLV